MNVGTTNIVNIVANKASGKIIPNKNMNVENDVFANMLNNFMINPHEIQELGLTVGAEDKEFETEEFNLKEEPRNELNLQSYLVDYYNYIFKDNIEMPQQISDKDRISSGSGFAESSKLFQIDNLSNGVITNKIIHYEDNLKESIYKKVVDIDAKHEQNLGDKITEQTVNFNSRNMKDLDLSLKISENAVDINTKHEQNFGHKVLVEVLNNKDIKNNVKHEQNFGHKILVEKVLNSDLKNIQNLTSILNNKDIENNTKHEQNLSYKAVSEKVINSNSKNIQDLSIEYNTVGKLDSETTETKSNNEKQEDSFEYTNLFELKGPLYEVDKNIVTVSDESTEIKNNVLTQVKDKIVFVAEDNKEVSNSVKYVEMELHPHSLGKVGVKMTIEDNKIMVEIKATNEDTQKILSSNIDELADILGKSKEVSIDILVKTTNLLEDMSGTNYNENYHQEEKQNNHNRQKYYYDIEDKEESDGDGGFSQLFHLKKQ